MSELRNDVEFYALRFLAVLSIGLAVSCYFPENIRDHLIFIICTIGLAIYFCMHLAANVSDRSLTAAKIVLSMISALLILNAAVKASYDIGEKGGSSIFMLYGSLQYMYMNVAMQIARPMIAISALLAFIAIFVSIKHSRVVICLLGLSANLASLGVHANKIYGVNPSVFMSDVMSISYQYDFTSHNCTNLPGVPKVLFTGDNNSVMVMGHDGHIVRALCTLDSQLPNGFRPQDQIKFNRFD